MGAHDIDGRPRYTCGVVHKKSRYSFIIKAPFATEGTYTHTGCVIKGRTNGRTTKEPNSATRSHPRAKEWVPSFCHSHRFQFWPFYHCIDFNKIRQLLWGETWQSTSGLASFSAYCSSGYGIKYAQLLIPDHATLQLWPMVEGKVLTHSKESYTLAIHHRAATAAW